MKTYVHADAFGNIATVTTDAREGWVEVPDGSPSSPFTAYVRDGQIVPYTPEQATAKASQPFPQATWSNATMAWIDPRTLADLKAAKLAELKAARDARQFGGFTWDGSPFDSDERSQSVLLGKFTTAALGALPDTHYRLADNSWRVLTASDMAQVWWALQTLIAGAFGQFAVLEAAALAATTPEEVSAIAWP